MKYSGEHIVVLSALEAVRQRPSMYVQDSSLLELYQELLKSTLDEKYCNKADAVHVEYYTNYGLRIIDNGRGIPVTFSQYHGFLRANIEYMFLNLYVGGSWEHFLFEEQGYLFGLGTILNALSSLFCLNTVWKDRYYSIDFSRGGIVSLLSQEPAKGRKGTNLYFIPDTSLLKCPKEIDDIRSCLENIQSRYSEKKISWERKVVLNNSGICGKV